MLKFQRLLFQRFLKRFCVQPVLWQSLHVRQWLQRSRLLFLLLGIGACCVVIFYSRGGNLFNVNNFNLLNKEAWVNYLHMTPTWGVSIFILAHTLAAILGIPGTFLVVVGGIAFGLVWGTLWSVVGATLGAIAAFGLARYFFQQCVEKRFGQHPMLKTLNQMVRKNEMSCVLAIRFAPISPFSVVNFLFGLTCVSFKSYAVGTFLGIVPGTLAYTWLGVAGHDAWNGNGTVSVIAALVLLAGLSAFPLLLQRHRHRSAER